MNKQQIFDTVAKHLIEQGEPAMLDNGGCYYRLPKDDGRVLKCAAGCLIPDEMYTPTIEGSKISSLECKSNIPEFLEKEIGLVRELQIIHDRPVEPDEVWVDTMKGRLNNLAYMYCLDHSVLST